MSLLPQSRRSRIGWAAAASIGVGFCVGMMRRGEATPAMIAQGRELFMHEWSVDDPLAAGDGLGPVFNERSCVACHFQGGVGGSGPRAATVNTFEIVDPERPRQLISGVVHKEATSEAHREDFGQVRERFGVANVVERHRIDSVCGGPRTVTVTKTNPIIPHVVDSPALFGLAVIESISDWTLVSGNAAKQLSDTAAAFRGDFRRGGRGVYRMVDGDVGRFGWKGQFADVESFVASACAMELGLGNSRVAQPLPGEHRGDRDATPDMTDEQLDALVAFVRSLPRPVQVLPADASERAEVVHGEAVFEEVGCAECHIRQLGDVDRIYTDFKLYELGTELSGGGDDGGFGYGFGSSTRTETLFDWPAHLPHADDWQTPPLWGVAVSGPYLHDGSAATLEAAINRHGGDARESRKSFRGRSVADRRALVRFLESLKAPTL